MNATGEVNVAILSDIHYAGPAERARGNDYELRALANPLTRWAVGTYRQLFWMRHPLDHAPQLDRFIASVGPVVSDELKSHGLRTDICPANEAYFMKPLISAMAAELGKRAPRAGAKR